ncbi:hypothetical protein AUK40_05435 [Candidatus Wirthbacteria bacterium CG2_30_54_11]|uniref:CoA-transferase n=1 Tax=Candidatus Wirthbacteria bacterium CG2_30_54_11 TaxID=1817892 RepID=A0A1J5INM0_9BACT|nr:MAG: hypothetical protein AUK40_05435 [Candidatus Wirthbacteria bacterium CG2_30_54_11]
MTTIITLKDIADLIPAGSRLICGGFQANRAPVGLVQALLDGPPGQFALTALPNPVPTDMLLRGDRLSLLDTSFNGLELSDGFHSSAGFRHAIECTNIGWKESDVYEIIQGMRAAAMGLPFIPAPEIAGSQYTESQYHRIHRVVDPFHGGESVFAVPPLNPDVALLHVQKADRNGNLWIEDPLYDEIILQASRLTIVSCEELVDSIDRPTISGLFVDHVLAIKNGAAPTGCRGYYGPDEKRLQEILGGTR